MPDTSSWITVIDVCRAMKIEPTPDLTWSVGPIVRTHYEGLYGAPPPKVLRQKTGGGGSHCFAIYPPEMRRVIESEIRKRQVEAERQASFDWGMA